MRYLSLLSCLAIALPALAQTPLPLHTQSRWIMDASDARVKLRCINWAGHGETNIPEGLHKQSIEYIADFISEQGFNCVRLTYSIDHGLNPTLSVKDSFANAAEAAELDASVLEDLYNRVVEKNAFVSDATIQDVSSAVISALWERNVMTILDNHVSKASWCCNIDDGNGWWDQASGYIAINSQYFNTDEWLAGLSAQAEWALTQPGVAAMSIRNELRPFPLFQDVDGHADWYNFVAQGARAVHDANPDVLVIIGGTQSATDLAFLKTTNLDFSDWKDKHVWEMHAYSFTVTYPSPSDNCDLSQAEYGFLNGFVLSQEEEYTAPLIMSEFGVGLSGGENDGLSDDDKAYWDCIKDYMTGNDMEWALWALQGTYYIREGEAEKEETWGYIDAEWNAVRNEVFADSLSSLFDVTQGP